MGREARRREDTPGGGDVAATHGPQGEVDPTSRDGPVRSEDNLHVGPGGVESVAMVPVAVVSRLVPVQSPVHPVVDRHLVVQTASVAGLQAERDDPELHPGAGLTADLPLTAEVVGVSSGPAGRLHHGGVAGICHDNIS